MSSTAFLGKGFLCVMFRIELKSCEESRILLGKRFSSVRGFSEGHC